MSIQHKRALSVAAHRGDCYNYYENTMTAFAAALQEGVDMIELDVQMTQDGGLIVMHDLAVDRTTDGRGLVANFTLEKISRLNAGNKNQVEKVPVFSDFMAWASSAGIYLNIEIKEYYTQGNEARCVECIEKVLALVEKHNMEDKILINSFDAYVLEYCYKKYGKKYMLHGFYPYNIMKNVEINPDEYLYCACIFDTKNKALYDDLIQKGIEPWIGASVTSESMLALAMEYGAKLVTTNNPLDAMAKIEKIKKGC